MYISRASSTMQHIMAPLTVFVVAGLSVVLANSNDPLIVTTKHGKLRGTTLTTYTGKTIYSFRGIRYAESPSGPNRFKVSYHYDHNLKFV